SHTEVISSFTLLHRHCDSAHGVDVTADIICFRHTSRLWRESVFPDLRFRFQCRVLKLHSFTFFYFETHILEDVNFICSWSCKLYCFHARVQIEVTQMAPFYVLLFLLPAVTYAVDLKPYNLTATFMFLDLDKDVSGYIDRNEIDSSFRECEIIFLPFLDDCLFNVTIEEDLNITSPFQLTGEWTILDQHIAPSIYSADLKSARVTLKLSRASLFYIVTVIAPMVLTSLLTSFVFVIPPESGEKVSFLISVFVSNAVFLNFIASTIPRRMTIVNIPRLTVFLLGVLLESFAALLATLFVIRTYNTERRNKTKRQEELILHQLKELMNTTREPDLLQSSHKDPTTGAHEMEDKFHAPKSRAANVANSFQTAFYLLLAKTQLSVAGHCHGPKQDTLKRILQVRIEVTQMAPFYVLLFLLPAVTYAVDLKPYNLTATFMFLDLDKDVSGYIDRNEIDSSFRRYDVNDNGRVSRSEYTTYINTNEPTLYDLSHALYDIYDVDSDDQLDLHDYENFFGLIDGDGNGQVSHYEFVRYWTILFTDLEHLHAQP
ncbi:hypothetical protein Btru_076188, partial [Bulinus truncatus]